MKFITELDDNKEEEDVEGVGKSALNSSSSSDIPEQKVSRNWSPKALTAPSRGDSSSDLDNLSQISFELTEEEIAALRRQYEEAEREGKM